MGKMKALIKQGHCELKTAERNENCLMIQVWAVLSSVTHTSGQRNKQNTNQIPKLKLPPFRYFNHNVSTP